MATFNMTVTQSCALCSAQVDISLCTPDQYETTMAAHHAVCPKRPIEVGDYVRWEFPGRNRFAEGEVTAIDGHRFTIRIDSCTSEPWGLGCPDPAPGCEHTFHVIQEPTTIRRIPRPAAAQATAQEADRFAVYQEKRADRSRYGLTPPTCAPGCQCGRHAPSSPAPALVDGITRDACLARWMENRLAVETRCAPPNVLTRMQREVARELWLQRYGAARSAELRGMVDADRAAERNRVRVDIQDVE